MPSIPSLDSIRHSLAHLLAHAVKEQFPNAKFAIGPVIDTGFYYDFALPRPLTEEDLPKLERRMRELITESLPFEQLNVEAAAAKASLKNQPYKAELIADLKKEGVTITFFKVGDFTDLCRGGHVSNTEEIPADAFQLDTIAGAYWRGSEKNPMLTRIYGLAFTTKTDLEAYLKRRQEAEARDHRRLGADLHIFTLAPEVGPGLPLWLPNGSLMIEELEKLAKETEEQAGYVRVRTPHIAKEELYKTSGHLPYYAESMFPPMTVREGSSTTKYYLRAMNCPHHHVLYATERRSYRDLPLRLAEYGTVYRYEKSGELFGLMRVRFLQMNDAHIYLAEEQFEAEFNAVNQLYLDYFKLFGIDQYVMRFSTHDPQELGKKYVDEPKLWRQTEEMVRKVLKRSKIHFVESPNDAAFYGPKIDVQVYSSIGKEFTLATNQVDFSQPRRFHLTYTDRAGKEKTPLVIHRAPLGTHERLIGFLLEHFAGAFPLWLSPIQVAVVPVGSRHNEPAQKLGQEFRQAGLRVEVDDANETVGNKIRKAAQQKVPYLLVLGDKELKTDKLAIRKRGQEKLVTLSKAGFLKKLQKAATERRLELP